MERGGRRVSLHRYSGHVLAGDYLRAAAGLGFTGGPVLFLDVTGVVAITLGGLVGLFAVFGARTAWRHGTVVEVTDDRAILHGPIGREIRWAEMTRCRLDHFTLRREGCSGWMQLRIDGAAGQKIRVESTIADFRRIAAATLSAAETRGLELSDVTAANFRALELGATSPIGQNAA